MEIKLAEKQEQTCPGAESERQGLTEMNNKTFGGGFSGCEIPRRQNCAGDTVVLAVRQRTISDKMMARCPEYHQWHVPAENLRVIWIIKPLA